MGKSNSLKPIVTEKEIQSTAVIPSDLDKMKIEHFIVCFCYKMSHFDYIKHNKIEKYFFKEPL